MFLVSLSNHDMINGYVVNLLIIPSYSLNQRDENFDGYWNVIGGYRNYS